MDSFALEQNLRAASARVMAGQQSLLSQRSQIRELEQCGLDAAPARALLRVYEQSQAMAVFDRNRFFSALSAAHDEAHEEVPASFNDDEREHDYFIDLDTYHRQAA